MDIYVGIWNTHPKIRAWTHYTFSNNNVAEALVWIVERSNFHWSCGRKVFDRNIQAEEYIKAGSYRVVNN